MGGVLVVWCRSYISTLFPLYHSVPVINITKSHQCQMSPVSKIFVGRWRFNMRGCAGQGDVPIVQSDSVTVSPDWHRKMCSQWPRYHGKRSVTLQTTQSCSAPQTNIATFLPWSYCDVAIRPLLFYLHSTEVHLAGCLSVEIMSCIRVQQADRLFFRHW